MRKPRVTHFQRRASAAGFSLEFIFTDVRQRLGEKIDFQVKHASCHSIGVIRRALNTAEATVFQSDINHVTGDINYVALLLNKRQTIVTILDCGFLNNKNQLSRWILKLFWLKFPVMRSRYVTAISEYTKRDIVREIGCDSEKVVVIPVAVSEIFAPAPKEFNVNRPVLLQVGATPNKNIARLAEALRGIDCELKIIGHLNQVDIAALEKNKICYENYFDLTLEEVYAAYVACDMVTFVSTFEGFGMPIIEANCVERPIITGNTSSMPEVACNAACLVDPYSVAAMREGIQQIINDRDYRRMLIENGRANRKRFSGDTIASQYLDLYQKILNDR